MCLIAFAIGASPQWPLVVAANRDEFLDRPTLPLACWRGADGQPIISGRDLLAGGTWLGATPSGRIAFLTNVRQGEIQAEPGLRSRGELVTHWLEAKSTAESFVAALLAEASDYGGFNLVLGDFRCNAWIWVTNRADANSLKWQARTLTPGVYGLSNAGLDTPWPKTTALKRTLEAALTAQSPTPDLEALQTPLWRALANRERAHGAALPMSGVSRLKEEALSSAFVDFEENSYGTRSSTLLTVSAANGKLEKCDGEIRIDERTYRWGDSKSGPGAYELCSNVFPLT